MKIGRRKRCGKCRSCGKTKKRFSHSSVDLRSTLPTTPAAAVLPQTQLSFYSQRVLEVRMRLLGKEHPDTLRSMGNLALTLRDQGDYAGARQLQERTREVSMRVLGEEHPDTLASTGSLALTLMLCGDHLGAQRLQEQSLNV